MITLHKKKVTYIKENIYCSLGPNDGETLVEEVSNVEVLPNGVWSTSGRWKGDSRARCLHSREYLVCSHRGQVGKSTGMEDGLGLLR